MALFTLSVESAAMEAEKSMLTRSYFKDSQGIFSFGFVCVVCVLEYLACIEIWR